MWHNPNEFGEEELRVLLVNMLYNPQDRRHFYDEAHQRQVQARHRQSFYDSELEVP